MKILVFVGIIFIILALMKFYIYKRFLKHTFIFKNHRFLAMGLLGIIYLAELAFFFLAKDRGFNHNIYIFLSFFVIITYFLFLVAIIGDIIFSITKQKNISLVSEGNHIQDYTRRKALKIILDLGIFILFFIFTFKGTRNALNIPDIKEVEVAIKGLKKDKHIVMVSDVHVGKVIQSDFLHGMVEKINSLNPDIVVIVGDLVDEHIDFVKEHLLVLNNLKSKEGVFYVSGNHEYYHGIESILDFLKTLKLNVLTNENVELEDFNIVGISDIAGIRFNILPPDIERAKIGLNENKPSILLTHQPKSLKMINHDGFDLILCGHTHAGQVFPLSIFVWLDQHYVHGLYRLENDANLYVSSGAGFWGPPIRFLAPSEIVSLRLKA